MATKHIFIGLGGSGVTTVANLKYKIYARTIAADNQTRLDSLNSTHRFFFIDTDDKAINEANTRHKKQFEEGRVRLIDDTERINLGDINPHAVYSTAVNEQDSEENQTITASCSQSTADSLQNQELNDGAGMIRMSSRIAFIRKSETFFNGITEAYNSLKDPNNHNGNDIKFWVVSSSCGGTGSGIVNDVLYYVNMAAQMQGVTGYPDVALVLYMPKKYMNDFGNSQQYANNAFALYKEIEQIAEWSQSEASSKNIHAFVNTLGHNINTENGYRPFRFCIPIDFEDELHRAFSNCKEMYSTTAELLDYIHDGNGAAAFRSLLINAETKCNNRNLHYTLIPIGYNAIRKPDEWFDRYLSLRFRYEFLKYGILGDGIDGNTCFNEVIKLFKEVVDLIGVSNRQKYIQDFLDKNLNSNIIQDSNRKTIVDPNGILYESMGTDVLTDFQKSLNENFGDIEQRKQNALKTIEQHIWRWVETNARAHGLLYVREILFKLDATIESLCTAYKNPVTSNDYTKIIEPLRTSIGAFNQLGFLNQINQIDLTNLAAKAFKVTPIEIITRDSSDVKNYLAGIRDWVSYNANKSLSDEICDILRAVAEGDNGVLDGIKNHVADLIDTTPCSAAEQDYRKLASTFYGLSSDVRTRYIPDITRFSNEGMRWTSDNLFAALYTKQIETSSYDEETGLPIPKHDDIEKIYNEAIRKYTELHLEEKGYYKDKESHFFINTVKNSSVVIEELTDIFVSVFRNMLYSNSDVEQKWVNKNLCDFINKDFTSEDLQAIRDEGKAAVMMCYDKQSGYNPITWDIKVAPNEEIANKVFSSLPGTKNEYPESKNSSEFYRLFARIGLQFKAYNSYRNQVDLYEASTQKELFHFHKNFAEQNISLPVNRVKVTFVRYLLLDYMKEDYKGILVQGTGAYNKGNFANSPILENGNEVLFATDNALSMNGSNDHIQLSTPNYYSIPIDNRDLYYSVLLENFTSSHNTNNYTNFIKRFIKDVDDLIPRFFGQHYADAKKTLHDDLDNLWKQANTNNHGAEQIVLEEFLALLDNQLRTVKQFLEL